MKTCAVTECDKAAFRKHYCRTHYTHWLENGDPVISKGYGKRRAQQYKHCARCGEAKHRDNFYLHSSGNLQAYCKPCHKVIMGAQAKAARLNRPKKEKVVVKCFFETCDRVGISRAVGSGIEGRLCSGHWNQAHKGQELRPLRQLFKSYLDENYRQCNTCEAVKSHEDFHNRTGGTGKQSSCKVCQGKVTRVNILLREDRAPEALAIAETMAGKDRKKYMAKATNAIKESDLERSNG